jgi:hypothetical protein
MSHGIRLLALAGALVAGTAFAAPVATEAAYRYHVTGAVTGTALPQNLMNGPLPFDSPYAALTPAQKDVLFNDYENLGPGDEPPYPYYGLHHVVNSLVTYAELNSPQGPLVAAVDVDSTGHAVAVTVYESPDPRLTKLVGAALNLEKYKPASCQGTPCKMQFVLRLNFPDRHDPVQNIAMQGGDASTAKAYLH